MNECSDKMTLQATWITLTGYYGTYKYVHPNQKFVLSKYAISKVIYTLIQTDAIKLIGTSSVCFGISMICNYMKKL